MPEGLREFKKKEKLLYAKLVAGSKAFFRAFVTFPRRFVAWGNRKASIVLLPHTGSASRRFQANRFAIGAMALGFVALLGFSLFVTGRYAVVVAMLESTRHELSDSRAAIDGLRDSAEALTGSALKFETRAFRAAGDRRAQEGAAGRRRFGG